MKKYFSPVLFNKVICIMFCLFLNTSPLTAQWMQTNGPYGGFVQAFAVSGTNLFTGTSGSGVWRRPLSEMITDVEDQGNEVPSQFILEQNYPNPFNPSTKIRYSVPQSSNVMIKVFDILGNEIETLVNEEKPIGSYEITWYAKSLPSGIYFYKIQSGSFVETKKMLLLK